MPFVDKWHRFARAVNDRVPNREQIGTRLDFSCPGPTMPMQGSSRLNIEPKRRSWDWAARNVSPGVRDPHPLADTTQFWRAVAQAATIVMAVLAFRRISLCGARAARSHSQRPDREPDAWPAHRARRALRIAAMGFGNAYRCGVCRRTLRRGRHAVGPGLRSARALAGNRHHHPREIPLHGSPAHRVA